VHVVEENVPVLFVVKVPVPVGVIAPVPEESAAVIVQVVGVLSSTLAGEQDTVARAGRTVEVTVKLPLLPV
jgi:hypothetical protein